MNKINKLGCVTERDIDLLILEELNVSEDFSSWFYSVIAGMKDAPKITGAWHSITDSVLGESDIVAIYENKTAILIENKIDAVAQPEQGARYKLRGSKGIKEKHWDKFVTCMIAPHLYLEKEKDSKVYDVVLSYECISDWFLLKSKSDKRSYYKSYIINEAIEQNRRGYTIIPDEKVTDFWAKYWILSINEYPDLEMKKPSVKPANADWPTFQPAFFRKFLTVIHKLERGYVDLQIQGASEKESKLFEYYSESEVDVVRTGKSVSLRFNVVPIDRFSSFESQEHIVIESLSKARKLLKIANDFSNENLTR